MVHSKDNILVIVEGAKCENNFFTQLGKVTTNNIVVVSYGDNIYNLYTKMKSFDLDDVIPVLLHEKNNVSFDDKQKLKNCKKWPYIYLIFDFDFQNCKNKKHIDEELKKIGYLLDFFTDQTDGKGKLLIDYPMMESYRDLINTDDLSYLDKFIEADFEQLCCYKQCVGGRGNSLNIKNYTQYNFLQLARINLLKLNKLLYGNKRKPYREEFFQDNLFNQRKIYDKQIELISSNQTIAIINSAILVFVDLNPKMLRNKK